jgi:aspartate/methionine/tyrosine aminotransferase
MKPKTKDLFLSNLVEKSLQGLSPIQMIMKMAEKRNIKQMGLNPEDVISFGGGWCNHYSPEKLRHTYQEIIKDKELFHNSGRYSSIKGSYKLRKQLCFYEEKIYNIKNLNPENIIIGHSSTQLYHDILRVILNPGENVCVLDPTYANYQNPVKINLSGGKLEFIPALDESTWTYMPDVNNSLEVLKKYCEHGSRLFIVPVPDNPTSQIPSSSFIRAAREILEDYNGYLIIDYAYKTLWFNDMPECFSWSPNDYENLITIHSNSKWLSSLGRRLGWVEANTDVIDGFEKINESNILSPDSLHSMATTKFLDETLNDGSLKSFINDTRLLYQKTANVMINSIKKYLGWKYLDPMGGLYTCCPVPNDCESIGFVQDLLKNTGVLFIPGTGFGPSMNHAVRLSYGPLCYDHDLIKEGIQRVGKYLNS